MNRSPTLATLLLAFALLPHGAALHCNGEITTIDAGALTLYLDDRSNGPGDINHWLYLESNDIEGLQSGGQLNPSLTCGSSPLDPCLPDPCQHPVPDTLIF